MSASNDSYKDSNKLKKKLINIKDSEVKDKLNISIGGDDSTEDENTDVGVSEKVENNFTKQEEITSNYIQVYNYDTNTYEVYNTNDVLNANAGIWNINSASEIINALGTIADSTDGSIPF